MRKYRRFSEGELEDAARKSLSISGMMRMLGYTKIAGGTHYHIKKKLARLGVDTSHFLGQGASSGDRHRGGYPKQSHLEILRNRKRDSCLKEPTHKLRRALLESGRKHQCELCGNEGIWNGKKLVLSIDHKNGDTFDNTPSNLRFLCPNCHSQTENFGVKKSNISGHQQACPGSPTDRD